MMVPEDMMTNIEYVEWREKWLKLEDNTTSPFQQSISWRINDETRSVVGILEQGNQKSLKHGSCRKRFKDKVIMERA